MRTAAMKGYRRKGAIAFAATVIAAVAMTGCGGAQSPPAVRLALTAPTEGAAVTVGNIKVFGTVDPASAAVVVAGRHAHVAHGVFARWMTVHKGLNHIKVVATAAGYAPAKLDIAVRSSPSAPRQPSSSAAPSASEAISTAPTTTGHRYDPRIQANLLRSCEATAGGSAAAEASCECYLAHLEARVSEKALLATERAVLKGEAKLPRWLLDAALSCRRK
jgi:hypothetical protein